MLFLYYEVFIGYILIVYCSYQVGEKDKRIIFEIYVFFINDKVFIRKKSLGILLFGVWFFVSVFGILQKIGYRVVGWRDNLQVGKVGGERGK